LEAGSFALNPDAFTRVCPTILQLKAWRGLVSGSFEGGARLKQIGLFEMRRLEALSNTIFGVAMTLLAYDLPKASRFANAPAWIDLLGAYAQPVIALMISFIVAGVFWLSHHRRLTFAPEGSRGEVFLNLIFLLSIVMLPVTNGLGVYRLVVAVSYGFHLTVIAGLNALLWSWRCEVPQSRVAGNRDLSGLRIRVRNGDGRRHAVHCAIHMVPGIWRASGGLVGGPALAPENKLASSISAKASSHAMTKCLAMGLVIAPHGRLDIDYEPRLPLLAPFGPDTST
jgi:uncharacterized membrane protein